MCTDFHLIPLATHVVCVCVYLCVCTFVCVRECACVWACVWCSSVRYVKYMHKQDCHGGGQLSVENHEVDIRIVCKLGIEYKECCRHCYLCNIHVNTIGNEQYLQVVWPASQPPWKTSLSFPQLKHKTHCLAIA